MALRKAWQCGWVSLAVTAMALGCGDDDDQPRDEGPACNFDEQSGCEPGLACEELPGGKFGCFKPVSVQGRVFDVATDLGIEGARVVARDANNAAVSTVVVTAADGTYDLLVPVPRTEDGTPVKRDYRMRADAAGYDTFPRPPREALPVDVSVAAGDPLVVKSTATDIGLIPLPNATGMGSVAGKVLSDVPRGTLVVAGSKTGIADNDGKYVVFNVPAGSVSVQGYKAGVNLRATTANVVAGAPTEGVDLAVLGNATAVVSGTVQIVNAPGGSTTSVILVVEDTFIENSILENAGTGEAPPGLRVYPVSGAWQIPDVPDGTYVALAAFENDELVRDPDTSIGGTELVTVTVPGAVEQGFKVTEALDVFRPNNGETVTGNPTFEWEDDSSEDAYEVVVFDALGTQMGPIITLAGVSGSKSVTATYGGTPALVPGMYYQFRATSIKGGVPISRTEDLKGVFVYGGN